MKTLLHISLSFFYVFVLCGLSFFYDDHLFSGSSVVVVSKASLEDEESSIRLVEGFSGSFCKWLVYV